MSRPDRTDHYLMVIAAEVRRILHGLCDVRADVKPEDFRLVFRKVSATEAEAEAPAGGKSVDDLASEMSKQRTLAMLGLAPKSGGG